MKDTKYNEYEFLWYPTAVHNNVVFDTGMPYIIPQTTQELKSLTFIYIKFHFLIIKKEIAHWILLEIEEQNKNINLLI